MSKIIKFFVMPMLFLSCVNAAYAYTLNKNVSGYVTDVFTNKPVSGVRVVYHPLSSVSHDFSAVTNSAGYYSIQNLPWYDVTGMANRIGYTISVSASGYLNFTSPTVYFNDKNAYNIQLFPASASAEISGVVKDQAGTALPVI
ncbi:MAG: carboxypeptidase-like regulatory domain-containing protein, partial [Candidatus Omnitrophica bacterium]|nr:carboxypeptidase-like regulatory domain-containing protein [Candidatus Omnitrophota bacterium]